MATVAFVAPVLPGGAEALRDLAAAVTGPRRAEHEAFHRRAGISRENWYLQQTPQGEMTIVYLESGDLPGAFQTLANSDHPYDRWFKEQAKSVHGIDFNQPPPGPLPEAIYDSNPR